METILYQRTRSIRFKLEPIEAEEIEKEITVIKTQDNDGLVQDCIFLVNKGNELANKLSKLICRDYNCDEQNNISLKLRKDVDVKYVWLRLYTKNEYYDWSEPNNKTKIYSLAEIPYLSEKFVHWFASWKRDLAILNEQITKKTEEQHNLNRRADIGLIIQSLSKRNSFPFIKEFIAAMNPKNASKIEIEEIVKEIDELLNKCEKGFLPTQSSGYPIARASLNYYTIFKNPKDFDKEILELSGEKFCNDNQNECEILKAFFTHCFDVDGFCGMFLDVKKLENICSKLNSIKNYQENDKQLIAEAIDNKIKLLNEEKDNSKKKKAKKIIEQLENDKKIVCNFWELQENFYVQERNSSKNNNNKYCLNKNYFLIQQLCQSMKLFKAREKARFNEAVQNNKDLPYGQLNQFFLFSAIQIGNENDKRKTDNEVFDDFMKHNKELHDISDKISTLKQNKNLDEKNKKELDKICTQKDQIAKSRGKYFTDLDHNKTYFSNYVKFCNVYREVALKAGQLKARIKGIEKEKIESQRLKYWSVIIEENKKQYVAFIPKSNDYAKKAYENYSKIYTNDNSINTCQLHYFESLTHRALEKLCFSGVQERTNTFQPEIKKELSIEKFPNYYEKGYFIKGEYFFNDKKTGIKDESKLIQFYKDVLNTQYAKSALKGIPWEQLKKTVLDIQFENFDGFRQALEKFSYVKHIKTKKDLLNELSKEYDAQIFEITSLDLKRQIKEDANLKEHTKIWMEFWSENNQSNNYLIRINPQLTITWRDSKESREKKYGEETSLYDVNKNNRFLKPQYTISFTITENATTQTMNTAFKDAQTKKDQIHEFNKQLFQSYQPQYFFGIDVGNIELATLCIINPEKDLNEEKMSKESLQYFDVYKLKKDQYNFSKPYHFKTRNETRERKAIDNLSYFAIEENYKQTFNDDNFEACFSDLFEKPVNTCAIDLTTAKVLGDKIFLNGDIKTYLSLKERNARRKICQIIEKHPNAKLLINGNKIFFQESTSCERTCLCQEPIYYFNDKYDREVQTLADINNRLEDYIKDKDKSELIEESKINHLRAAIAANMTGVIYHLFEKYQSLIVLEYLTISDIASHKKGLKAFEGNITRPLQIALFRKFLKSSLVPPALSEIIQLREKAKDRITKIGIINFIDKTATSVSCPNCLGKFENYNDNKRKGFCLCPDCGFDTRTDLKGFEGLDGPDKVAAFNIAKRGFEDLQKHK